MNKQIKILMDKILDTDDLEFCDNINGCFEGPVNRSLVLFLMGVYYGQKSDLAGATIAENATGSPEVTALSALKHCLRLMTKDNRNPLIRAIPDYSEEHRNKNIYRLEDKAPAKVYVGTVRDCQNPQGSEEKQEFKELICSVGFHPTVEAMNDAKIKRDEEDHALQEKVIQFRGKEYKGRSFRGELRNLILERDNYTCQICLKSDHQLALEGRHLEVDHITPFAEGGKTTYDNGRVVCDECNKGIYHARNKQSALVKISQPAL